MQLPGHLSQKQVITQKHNIGLQHNFVLNENVGSDRLRAELSTYNLFTRLVINWDVQAITDGPVTRLMKLWLAGLLLVIPIVIVLSLTSEGYNIDNLGSDWQGVTAGYLAAIYMIIVPMALMPFYALQSGKTPTNLLLSPTGFSLQWCYEKTKESPAIAWSQILSATVWKTPLLKDSARAGRYVVLEVDLGHLSVGDQYALGNACKSRKSWLSFTGKHAHLYISLDAFTRESDREMFVNFLCKHLTGEQIDKSVLDENRISLNDRDPVYLDNGSSSTAPTYTNMWLDDMHSTRRRSVEPLAPGQKLQETRYTILDKLATGGQATVYRARDNLKVASNHAAGDDDKYVVLKEFVLPVSAGSQVRNRSFENVKNEADVLSSLDHQGIIKLKDYFVEDHRAYLVLESVHGTTLRDLVLTGGALSDKRVEEIASELCSILKYLHEKEPPIVHRDISPDNLMLTADGAIKLLDFNVAQRMESNETKTVVGKHNYIAPEQFRGKPVTQSDLYSLGGTLFFLLTGEDPVPLSRSSLSEKAVLSSFENIVAGLTETNLETRFKTVDQVLKELSTVEEDSGETIAVSANEKHLA